ncbi:Uncharacterised protein [Sphingobacterium thalpophilum]|uniref:Uncharacterized protein n=1 Tax=Sphingobacterium thalpophilum TaxID=259 RepID=A0A4U9VF12_9SPHI|nr:Uncharacterised protein [Sphingobacterium thalpophilum]
MKLVSNFQFGCQYHEFFSGLTVFNAFDLLLYLFIAIWTADYFQTFCGVQMFIEWSQKRSVHCFK